MDQKFTADGAVKVAKFSAVQRVLLFSATNVFEEISRNHTLKKLRKPTTGAALFVTKVFFKIIAVIIGLCVILW